MTESSEEQELKEVGMISHEEGRQPFLQNSAINGAKSRTKGTFCFGANVEDRDLLQENELEFTS